MTSEEEERPRFVTGDYGVNGLSELTKSKMETDPIFLQGVYRMVKS